MSYSLLPEKHLVYIEGIAYDKDSLWQWLIEEREKESDIYGDLVHIYVLLTKRP